MAKPTSWKDTKKAKPSWPKSSSVVEKKYDDKIDAASWAAVIEKENSGKKEDTEWSKKVKSSTNARKEKKKYAFVHKVLEQESFVDRFRVLLERGMGIRYQVLFEFYDMSLYADPGDILKTLQYSVPKNLEAAEVYMALSESFYKSDAYKSMAKKYEVGPEKFYRPLQLDIQFLHNMTKCLYALNKDSEKVFYDFKIKPVDCIPEESIPDDDGKFNFISIFYNVVQAKKCLLSTNTKYGINTAGEENSSQDFTPFIKGKLAGSDIGGESPIITCLEKYDDVITISNNLHPLYTDQEEFSLSFFENFVVSNKNDSDYICNLSRDSVTNKSLFLAYLSAFDTLQLKKSGSRSGSTYNRPRIGFNITDLPKEKS